MLRAWKVTGFLGVVCGLAACSGGHHGGKGAGGSSSSLFGGTTSDDDSSPFDNLSDGGNGSDPVAGRPNTSGGAINSGGASNGGVSNGGASNGGDDIPLASFPAALAKTSCARIFECCTAQERSGSPIGASPAQCEQLYEQVATVLVGPLQQSQAAGRAAYDSAALARCLSSYASTSCTDLRNSDAMLAACKEFVVPKVALGRSCTQSYECTQGYCDSSSSACAARKGNGATCTGGDDECQSDFCDVDTCAPAVAAEGGLCALE
jgi:hypothetical protein